MAPSTTPREEGTEISPRRYLADTASAASAVNAFSETLEGVGTEPRIPVLRRAADDLDAAYRRAAGLAERIDAARLQDTRLEDQRAAASATLLNVVNAMRLVVVAARQGDPVDAENAATGFITAVGALRSLPAP